MNDYQPKAISINDLTPFELFVVKGLLLVKPVPLLPPARIERIRQRHAVLKATWARIEEEVRGLDEEDVD